MRMVGWLAACSALALAACATAPDAAQDTAMMDAAADAKEMAKDGTETAGAAKLAEVLAHPRRADDMARDGDRHPFETLMFFGVEPDDTVVETLPGGGWYSRILIPYLDGEGRYVAMNYDVSLLKKLYGDRLSPEREAFFANWSETFPAFVDETWGMGEGKVAAAFTHASVPDELKGTADVALAIRELHNLACQGEMEEGVQALYDVLKPGGVAGVVQHRAKADAPADYANGCKGYLKEADVIAAMTAAGFVLEAASEVNANPADTADWDAGVWALPPAVRGGQDDPELAARMRAIGESDRMTLRFRKPA